MADINTATWSETAASNNTSAPDGFPEGMSYASVNDAAREMMSAVKREWNRSHPTLATGGTSTAITLTYTTAPTAYSDGLMFSFVVTTSCGAGPTLNVNTLGAKKIFVNSLAGPVAATTGDLIAGNAYTVAYRASLDSAAGGFIILGSTIAGRMSSIYMGSSQTIPNNSTTTLNGWSATTINTLGAWSAGSPSRLTVPAGVTQVLITASTSWSYAGSTGQIVTWILKNGSATRGRDTRKAADGTEATISRVDTCTAGDYYEMLVLQSTGGAVDFVGSGDGAFTMTALR